VLAVALLARAARSVRVAAATSAVFFTVMSVAYYGWAVGVLGFGLRANLVLLAAWTVLSLTAVPLFAVVVHLATRRRGVLPGTVLAGAAAVALADRTLWQLWLAASGGLPPGTPLHPVQAVAGVVVALVVAGVLPRHGRTRAVALVLLVPAAVLATLGVDLLYGLLPG
jgi:GAF domain-containing protein